VNGWVCTGQERSSVQPPVPGVSVLCYRYAIRPKRPRIAILVPQMPSDDVLELASSLDIGVI
jgi:hypothetical protein